MKPLEELMATQSEVTIQTLADYVHDHVREHWQRVLLESQEELQRSYNEAGEPSYGAYAQKVFRPVRAQFEGAGFLSEPRFPGTLSTSMEWGPPEDRERWMWSVVKQGHGAPLGTLVVGLFHDHTRFRIPRAPGVLALKETSADAIVGTISHAADNRKRNES